MSATQSLVFAPFFVQYGGILLGWLPALKRKRGRLAPFLWVQKSQSRLISTMGRLVSVFHSCA